MVKYILKRVLMVIPVLLGVVLLVFTICEFTPGDPVYSIIGTNVSQEVYEAKKAELGLDRPFLVRYVDYVVGIVTEFDFGVSYGTGRNVGTELMGRLPQTFKLGIASILLSVIIGIPLGVLAATKHNSMRDRVIASGSLVFASIPDFWNGIMLMLFFALYLGILPATGTDSWKGYILPIVSLGLPPVASLTRMTRSSMLETIRQDYIRTARAKGLPEGTVIKRHALRNSLIPVMTTVGALMGSTVAGSVVVETLFGIPGVGTLLRNAITTRDYPLMQGGVLMLAIWISLVNLLVDVLYAVVDPRIRAVYSAGKTRKKAGAQPKEGVEEHGEN